MSASECMHGDRPTVSKFIRVVRQTETVLKLRQNVPAITEPLNASNDFELLEKSGTFPHSELNYPETYTLPRFIPSTGDRGNADWQFLFSYRSNHVLPRKCSKLRNCELHLLID